MRSRLVAPRRSDSPAAGCSIGGRCRGRGYGLIGVTARSGQQPVRQAEEAAALLPPCRLGVDGKPQLRHDHPVTPSSLHQQAGGKVRPGHQLPQHLPPQPAELHRRHFGAQLCGHCEVHARLQPDTGLHHVGAQHLQPGRDVEGVRAVDAVELRQGRLRRVRGAAQPAAVLHAADEMLFLRRAVLAARNRPISRQASGLLVHHAELDQRHA